MRMSCNGCRILRKGCSENCTLKPCLQWIRSPESQANVTLFLAKFYGRAGLINLISAGPDHLRPEIFRSLLYEACGRIINPIFGSVGLMWSGNWQRCQAAVEAVLKGKPIMQFSLDNNGAADQQPIMPLHGCDIRHLSKDTNVVRRVRTRNRFKRSGLHGKRPVDPVAELIIESTKFSITGWDYDQKDELTSASSHDSFSVETVEPTLLNRNEPVLGVKSKIGTGSGDQDGEVLLELTLGMNRVMQPHLSRLEELFDTDG